MNDVNSAATTQHQSKFAYHYKQTAVTNKEESQEKRRHERLKTIKEKRHASIDEKRNITDVFKKHVEDGEPMDTDVNRTKTKRKYANRLMLSEWMIEKPDDFETQWLIKLCPKGIRTLIVAHKARTKSYSKSGYFLKEFVSQLPGGSSSSTPNKFTILDCIYSEDTNMFHVLDVLVWNSCSTIDCSTEFRFFFLASRMQELPTLHEISKGNKFAFSVVPYYQSQIPIMENLLTSFSNHLDGILFYHKECCYLSEITPLVTWLKVFMLPEIFEMHINHEYFFERSTNYTTYLDYIKTWRKVKVKKKLQDVEMQEQQDESNTFI